MIHKSRHRSKRRSRSRSKRRSRSRSKRRSRRRSKRRSRRRSKRRSRRRSRRSNLKGGGGCGSKNKSSPCKVSVETRVLRKHIQKMPITEKREAIKKMSQTQRKAVVAAIKAKH